MKQFIIIFIALFHFSGYSNTCESNRAVYEMTCQINAPYALSIIKSCGSGIYDALITDNIESVKSIGSGLKSYFTNLTLKDLCRYNPITAIPTFLYDSYNFLTDEDVLPIIQEIISLILSRDINGLKNLLYQLFEPILLKIKGTYKHIRAEVEEAFEGFLTLFQDPTFYNHAAELTCNFLSSSGIGVILSIFTAGAGTGILAFNVMKSAHNIKKVTSRLSKLKTKTDKLRGMKCAI